MTTPSFSAALLVGGQSIRMGRDKAFLTLPGSDVPLWQRQWQTLAILDPEEILWSGPPRPGLPPNIRCVPDAIPAAGPLAGISACLHASRSDLLIVLAIDLPQMTATFLRDLLARCSKDRGAVIRHGDFFEPLAAVYPRQVADLASAHLAQERLSMQDLIRMAVQQGLFREFPLDDKDLNLYQNINRPEDLSRLSFQPAAD